MLKLLKIKNRIYCKKITIIIIRDKNYKIIFRGNITKFIYWFNKFQ
jgi:hypothetical protein